MIQLDLARVEERETERMKEPAKGWRNKWRASEDAEYTDTILRRRGAIFWARTVRPSREIAEQIAHKNIEDQIASGWQPDEYLGAFPVSP